MPIYEFYCSDCNTLLNFFSDRIDTRSKPTCPHCQRPDLERRPASFATLRHGDEPDQDPFASLDDAALDQLMGSMVNDMEGMDESENPRQLAQVFRRLGEATGMEAGPRLQELLAGLDAGEDPAQLEDGLGEESEESFEDYFRLKKKLAAELKRRPRLDDTLYFL